MWGGSLALFILGANAVQPPAILNPVNLSLWTTECLRAFQVGQGFRAYAVDMDVSSYDLEEMGGGLCTEWLACSFENCYINRTSSWEVLSTFNPETDPISKITDTGAKFNLPSYTSFPKSVKDVVNVVKYADATNISLSVKLSGHSYAGQSTQKNSIQINMKSFPKYSQISMLRTLMKDQYTVNATTQQGTWVSGPLPSALWCDYLPAEALTPACKLAKARGKPAVLRVGGGEHWDDAYRAVDDVNYFFGKWYGQTVEIMGGGAGTVGATGGWVQGTGLSIGDERRWGFGADHILEIEMVLADGTHVKFGPTEWEDAPGFQYPKTTKVTGYCNSNVDVNEEKWQWQSCDRSFADLWFAVRGGGGGTWGVVTALTYQLHPRRTVQTLGFNVSSLYYILVTAGTQNVSTTPLQNYFSDFVVDLLFNPENLGLSQEVSVNCGHSALRLAFSDMLGGVTPGTGAYLLMWCHDKGAEQVAAAYARHVDSYFDKLPQPLAAILLPVKELWANPFVIKESMSYSSFAISLFSSMPSYQPAPIGHVYDSPHPQVDSQARNCWSAFVPEEFLKLKNDDVHLVMSLGDAHVTGGYAATSHDQMSAIPAVQRSSGLQKHICGTGMDLLLPIFQKLYPQPGPGEAITGGGELNHIGPDAFGPLKSNTSKTCPTEYSHAQREANCHSYQEFVWGTSGLQRLERIKKAVDPKNLFNCQKCVGYDPTR